MASEKKCANKTKKVKNWISFCDIEIGMEVDTIG